MVVLCVVKTQLKFLLEFSSVIQIKFCRGALLCVPQSLFGPPAALFFCRLLCLALTFRYFIKR
jgi:hypothetical protein